MTLKARISIIAAAAAIGIAAGCGGGSSSSTTSTTNQGFNDAFLAATAPLKQTVTAIGKALGGAQGQTNTQVESTFGDLADQWKSQSTKLDSLDPPEAAATSFSALKTAVSAVGADLNAISAAARSGDASAARSASVKLVSDVKLAKGAAIKVQADANGSAADTDTGTGT